MNIRMATISAVAVLIHVTAALEGAELTVGPGKSFARIEPALAKATPGDVILVFPLEDNKPYGQVAVYVAKPNIVFRAVNSRGQRVRL